MAISVEDGAKLLEEILNLNMRASDRFWNVLDAYDLRWDLDTMTMNGLAHMAIYEVIRRNHGYAVDRALASIIHQLMGGV
jgi:hypothetical protein